MSTLTVPTDFARLLRLFFLHRLIQQRHVSHQTVASYRDTFRLLLRFAERRLEKPACQLCLSDLDANLVLGFLDDLEQQRHNCVRRRNARLAAIRSFLHYAALQEPTALPQIQRVLAIPMKRFDRPVIGFLSREEREAILNAPDLSTWSGRRDQALLATLYDTGARVSEVIAITRGDIESQYGSAVPLHGKGRKARVVPLSKSTATLVRRWMREIGADIQQPLFPNRFGQSMSRSGVEKRLQVAVGLAVSFCPSLRDKTISPHVVRHSTALHLLQAGVDLTVIALYLGHESVATTHHYLQADLTMKERALAALQPLKTKPARFKPAPEVLAFLDAL